ncbi:MAG: hypothetical protein RUDDFDWM_001340 [Candidatus Fervidibacterota bacterium]
MKLVGLAKRRSIAKALCDAKRVTLNGYPAKASACVKVGDTIEIRWGNRTVRAKVLKIPNGQLQKERRSEYVEVIAQLSDATEEDEVSS